MQSEGEWVKPLWMKYGRFVNYSSTLTTHSFVRDFVFYFTSQFWILVALITFASANYSPIKWSSSWIVQGPSSFIELFTIHRKNTNYTLRLGGECESWDERMFSPLCSLIKSLSGDSLCLHLHFCKSYSLTFHIDGTNNEFMSNFFIYMKAWNGRLESVPEAIFEV